MAPVVEYLPIKVDPEINPSIANRQKNKQTEKPKPQLSPSEHYKHVAQFNT
jgi:hypothetical protein